MTTLLNAPGRPHFLRRLSEQHAAQEITLTQLTDGCYGYSLTIIDAFRWRPLPSPPLEIKDYRAMTQAQRDDMPEKAKTKLFIDHRDFFDDEDEISGGNVSNHLWLQEMAVWGQTQPPIIQTQITAVLSTYDNRPGYDQPWVDTAEAI